MSPDLDALMHRGWPALSTTEVDGWLVRTSAGLTQRANSVLPLRPPRDLAAALEQVERRYRSEGLAPAFQISPTAAPAGLDQMLAARGYLLRSPTLVQTARGRDVLARVPAADGDVHLSAEPGGAWLALWESIDGRTGTVPRSLVLRLLTGGPAVYAAVRDPQGTAAVGRLALVDDWAGIYCMAVRPDARRRGLGRTVLRALARAAEERGAKGLWLQVAAGNPSARALYEGCGFRTAFRYHFRARTRP